VTTVYRQNIAAAAAAAETILCRVAGSSHHYFTTVLAACYSLESFAARRMDVSDSFIKREKPTVVVHNVVLISNLVETRKIKKNLVQ
jgi:hypothetical protein